ncbi:MAG: hypothetical protein R8K54_04465 [Mariprofundaceae bacterium]
MRILTGTLLIVLTLSISACGLIPKQEAGKSKKSTSTQSGKVINQTTPVNMIAEFDDIPVPVELSREDEQSSVYESPGFAVGVIVYEGYYKSASISKFFRAEMPKYQWQFINAFSEGKRYTLTFLKANRSCAISIEEGSLATRLVIRVGPTSGG